MTDIQKELYKATVDRTIDRMLMPKQQLFNQIVSTEPLPERSCKIKSKPIYAFDDNPDNDP